MMKNQTTLTIQRNNALKLKRMAYGTIRIAEIRSQQCTIYLVHLFVVLIRIPQPAILLQIVLMALGIVQPYPAADYLSHLIVTSDELSK